MKLLVLHGPNLNLLGTRETEHYGQATLDEIQQDLDTLAAELGVELVHLQSNSEGALVDRARPQASGCARPVGERGVRRAATR